MQLSKEEMQKMFDAVHSGNQSQSNSSSSKNVSPSKEEMQRMFNEVHGEEEPTKESTQQQNPFGLRENDLDLLNKVKQRQGGSFKDSLQALSNLPVDIGSSLAQQGYDTLKFASKLNPYLTGGKVQELPEFEVPLHHPGSPGEKGLEAYEAISGGKPLYDLGTKGLRYAGSKLLPAFEKYSGKTASKEAENLYNKEYENYFQKSEQLQKTNEDKISQHRDLLEELQQKAKSHEFLRENEINESNQRSTNLIKDLLHGEKIGQEYKPVSSEIKNIHENALSDYRKEIKVLNEEVSKDWFLEHANRSPFMSTKESNQASNIVNSVIDRVSSIKGLPESIEEKLNSIKKNPSFDNMHFLQSELGEIGSAYKNSLIGSEKHLGGKILNVREFVKDAIKKSIEKQNPELAEKYTKLSDEYLKNVVPFKTDPILQKLTSKKGMEELGGENVDKIFKKGSVAVENVFNRLSDKAKDLLLAKRLSKSVENIPGQDMSIAAEKLIKESSKLGSENLDKLLSERSHQEISNIYNKLQRAKQNAQLAKEHGLAHAEGTKQLSELEKSLLSEQTAFEKTSSKNLLELLKKSEQASKKYSTNIKGLKVLGLGAVGYGAPKAYNTIQKLLGGGSE